MSSIDFNKIFNPINEVHYGDIIKDHSLIRNVLYCILDDIYTQIKKKEYKFNEIEMFKILNHANKYIIDCKTLLDLDVYLYAVHDTFFSDMDISFKKSLEKLFYSKVHFPVDHIELQNYGILSNIDKNTGHIKRLIETYKYIEGIDFIKIKRTEKNNYRKNIDYLSNDKLITYYFTTTCFKQILIRAVNTDKYAKYYLLLERVYVYYNNYIHQAQQKIIEKGRIEFNNFEFYSEKKIQNLELQKELLQNLNHELNESCDELYLQVHDLKDIEDRYDEEADSNLELISKVSDLESKIKDDKSKDKLIIKLQKLYDLSEEDNDDLRTQIQELELKIDELNDEIENLKNVE